MLRVVIFYVLAFVFTFVLGWAQFAISFAFSLPQLGPGLAALVMVRVLFRQDSQPLSIFDRQVPVLRYQLALLIPAGGALIIYLINSARLGSVDNSGMPSLAWLLVLMPLGAFGEELGWRGYLHKHLNTHANGLLSSLVVGVLWALWHMGYYQNGPVYMIFFAILMVSYSVVIYALVVDTGFNVLLATIFHVMINLTTLPSFAIFNRVDFIVVSSLVWAVIAAAVVLMRRSLFLGQRVG